MFAFIWGYNYFSKEKSIETYIENDGGADTYSNLVIDENTTASVTAKGNNMKIVISLESDDEDVIKEQTKYYKKGDGVDDMKYVAAYYLYLIKPETRAIKAEVSCITKINGEKVKKISMDYKEAEELLTEYGLIEEE